MTTRRLVDLPSELLFLIFQYFTSIELLAIFTRLQCVRIEELLQSFISFVDISRETRVCIDRYLPYAITQCKIVRLRLQDKQINVVSKYLSSSDVQSMEVISLGSNDPIVEEDLFQLRGCLKELTIKILCSMERTIPAEDAFGDRRTNEVLRFSYASRFFNQEKNSCANWPHLTHLCIDLDTIYDVFVILNHLPNLQNLKVFVQFLLR